MKEKNWSEVTRLPEEDLALVSGIHSSGPIRRLHTVLFLVMSATILTVYLFMNFSFFPGFPVMMGGAESSQEYAEHYPPFRMNEWTNYSITQDIIHGKFTDAESLSHKNPVGFSLVSVPLTLAWGQTGPYFTNAFIMWLSALVFFFLVLDVTSFPVAVGAALTLALATPNLFFAASAFAEPLGQLLTMLALFLFHKGLSAERDRLFFLLCGLSSGLTLFVQPVLAFAIIPYCIILVMENGQWSWEDRNVHFLLGGFAAPLVVYLISGILHYGTLFPFLFSPPYSPYNLLSHRVPGGESNVVSGIWKIFLDHPQGLFSLMPVLVLAPMGFITMWRNGNYMLVSIAGAIIGMTALLAASGAAPLTGETLGPRQLLPVLPLLILPLAFLWDEGAGERVWLAALLALTFYMSGFGWWTSLGERGVAPGETLQDRSARYILLSRKNRLDHPRFASGEELKRRFTDSLRSRDMGKWLGTLSSPSRAEITGIERDVFECLVRRAAGAGGVTEYMGEANPSTGIHLVVPTLEMTAPAEQETNN